LKGQVTEMGLAAAQARLLSITSRMSDNELRAQLINNKKIRLANESARASEKYLNALNNAKLMFRNFDNENVEANQQLTFNALTAYGPYNTQYGLVNANGQMLVSEEMANAFEAANGDLEKFLKGFGLEKKSHFFNSIVNQYGQDETVMNVAKSLGAVNNDGTINDNLLIDTLENLYPAYLETIQSKDYQGYKANFDKVVNALTDYDKQVESQIKTELKSYYNTDSSVSLVTASNNYEKLNNSLTEINNTSGGWWNTTNLLTNSGVNYATMLTEKRLGTVFSGENYEFNANNAKVSESNQYNLNVVQVSDMGSMMMAFFNELGFYSVGSENEVMQKIEVSYDASESSTRYLPTFIKDGSIVDSNSEDAEIHFYAKYNNETKQYIAKSLNADDNLNDFTEICYIKETEGSYAICTPGNEDDINNFITVKKLNDIEKVFAALILATSAIAVSTENFKSSEEVEPVLTVNNNNKFLINTSSNDSKTITFDNSVDTNFVVNFDQRNSSQNRAYFGGKQILFTDIETKLNAEKMSNINRSINYLENNQSIYKLEGLPGTFVKDFDTVFKNVKLVKYTNNNGTISSEQVDDAQIAYDKNNNTITVKYNFHEEDVVGRIDNNDVTVKDKYNLYDEINIKIRPSFASNGYVGINDILSFNHKSNSGCDKTVTISSQIIDDDNTNYLFPGVLGQPGENVAGSITTGTIFEFLGNVGATIYQGQNILTDSNDPVLVTKYEITEGEETTNYYRVEGLAANEEGTQYSKTLLFEGTENDYYNLYAQKLQENVNLAIAEFLTSDYMNYVNYNKVPDLHNYIGFDQGGEVTVDKYALSNILSRLYRNDEGQIVLNDQGESFSRDLNTYIGLYFTKTDGRWGLNLTNTNMMNELSESDQAIAKAFVLDSLFDKFGDPTWAWVDTADRNFGDAEAKVQWYTNIFNQMMNKGYTVLLDGLAASTQWIEYALESGLVTMTQVDSENNWKNIGYANCADISEATDNAAVTLAEAEYRMAIQKIQAKDQRFDMELKNIDTEHTALQTEMDSIKTAMNKHIDRTFKYLG